VIRKIVFRYALVWLADTASITITALVLPGIYFVREAPFWYLYPFIVALLLGLLNALVRPVLLVLLLPITFVTLGLATFLLNAGLFYLTDILVDSFVIETFGAALIGVFVLTFVNTLLGNLIQLGDDYSFYATMMNKFSALTGPKDAGHKGRGLIILQIDGLSYSSVKRAIQRGKMPYLGAMLKRRRYVIRKWFSGLPSQTSAVQAGMFYGDSFDIPGFRWYDKSAKRLVTSSNASDMRALDDRFDSTEAPLLKNGTVINSLLHGGAAKRILTVSAFSDKDLKQHRGSLEDFAIFSLHPYLYTRTFLLMIWDFIVDRFETTMDLIKRKRPKLTRSIKFSFFRAIVNTFFRESTTYFLMEDIVRGVPVIYANYLGYDMVSHYGGPTSWDALSTLTGIDRQIKKISRRIAKKSRKHYDLVVLSDHGQAPSSSFRSLYGKSLRESIEEHLQMPLSEPSGHPAELGYFNTLLREVRMVEEAYGTRSIRSGRRTLERLHSRIREDRPDERDESIVVCASGNLAHVYFTDTPGRVTTEYLIKKHPTLLEYLVSHPGVGFLVTTNDEGEHLMMARQGVRRLRAGVVEGVDPAALFADGHEVGLIVRTLVRMCQYPNSGDLIINGNMMSDGVVVTFEEQRGTHGGLGGDQTEAFVVVPRRFRSLNTPVQNPAQMYKFLTALTAD
jgi:uncharacterized membrane protein YvlD (DUF360 family)